MVWKHSFNMRRNRVERGLGAAVLVTLGLTLGGCETITNYANLRNSFLAPNEVGRFSKANPFYATEAKPTKWPILDSVDVVDEPNSRWTNAGDPTAEDLVPQIKEQVLGPGDTVQISVYELTQPGQDYVKQARINEYGVVSMWGVGALSVAGLTPSQVEQKLSDRLVEAKLLPIPAPGKPGPQVSVLVLDSRQRLFSALGSVARPGTYSILSFDFRLLDAVALIGDIPTQPGMDYLYIIRQSPLAEGPATLTAPDSTGGTPPSTGRGTSPSGILQDIERGADHPPTDIPESGPPRMSPGTGPASAPGTAPKNGPTSAAPLNTLYPPPTVRVVSNGLCAAPTSPPDQQLLPKTISEPTTPAPAGNYSFVNSHWVLALDSVAAPTGTQPGALVVEPNATAPSTAAATEAATGPAATTTAATGPATTQASLTQQRVIKIPLAALREGVSKYNVIIRPGDIINVPAVEPGEFYLMGHVARAGVYTLTGRKITLKQAVASAGGLDSVAIPRRCDLIRRIGPDQEATVQVNLQAIFDGEQPDIFLKANDVLNVGTDAVAPFLAVMRNAYRASYGWGFTYDKNFNTSSNTGF